MLCKSCHYLQIPEVLGHPKVPGHQLCQVIQVNRHVLSNQICLAGPLHLKSNMVTTKVPSSFQYLQSYNYIHKQKSYPWSESSLLNSSRYKLVVVAQAEVCITSPVAAFHWHSKEFSVVNHFQDHSTCCYQSWHHTSYTTAAAPHSAAFTQKHYQSAWQECIKHVLAVVKHGICMFLDRVISIARKTFITHWE